MISWLHYVLHADVPAFEAAGWRYASDLGPTHGRYSVLMIWAGEGDPASVAQRSDLPSTSLDLA